MSVAFSKFHPNYVIGGTYSGQIVLWDTRSGKRTPIQRSPLSSSAHTHPIYSLDVVGSQNAHNLISVSTDGKMCSWNLDMLSQPQVREKNKNIFFFLLFMLIVLIQPRPQAHSQRFNVAR